MHRLEVEWNRSKGHCWYCGKFFPDFGAGKGYFSHAVDDSNGQYMVIQCLACDTILLGYNSMQFKKRQIFGNVNWSNDERYVETIDLYKEMLKPDGSVMFWHEVEFEVNKNKIAQASMLCAQKGFQMFLNDQVKFKTGVRVSCKDQARESVREWCKVESLGELNKNAEAVKRFDKLNALFEYWM